MKTDRVLAGISFGCAGFLASLAVMLFFRISGGIEVYLVYMAVPALGAGAAGAWAGAAIRDPQEVKNWVDAVKRGAMVVVLSYLFFWTVFALIFTFTAPPGGLVGNAYAILVFITFSTFWTLLPSLLLATFTALIVYKTRG